MDRIIGNYLNQANRDFPLDCETLKYIQDNEVLLAMLGNIAGDKAVIYGCERNGAGTERASGFVFLRTKAFPQGELLPWEGGRVTSGMYIKEENISVSSQGYQYPQAYTKRSLAPGIGTENYDWKEFKDIKTIQQLEQLCGSLQGQIDRIKPTSIGVVEMWAGVASANAIPENYALCDGSVLSQEVYSDLYAVIGRLHTPVNVQPGYFCLPDLQSRFVVGYNPADEDYNTVGKTGGDKTVTLTEEEIPAHDHDYKNYYHVERTTGGVDGDEAVGKSIAGSYGVDNDNRFFWYKNSTTLGAGEGKAHENRPPFYTLAYIIRVK